MKQKQTIESQLHCKATAELDDSVINDMLKSDGNLKELLENDRPIEDDENASDGSSEELSR